MKYEYLSCTLHIRTHPVITQYLQPEAEQLLLFRNLLASVVLITMGGSPGELSEELVTQEKRKKGWRLNCDVGEATEGLENEL